MEMTTFTIRVILPDGKNKLIVTEEVTAKRYYTDENNNLIFVDQNHNLIIEYHNYNWVSVTVN